MTIERRVCCLALQAEEKAPQVRRTLQQYVNDPVILSFTLAPEDDSPAHSSQQPPASLAGRSLLGSWGGSTDGGVLPPNLHLLTLMGVEGGDILLRLAHLYQVQTRLMEYKLLSPLESSSFARGASSQPVQLVHS